MSAADPLERVPTSWPHRRWSRVVRCGDLEWHVQVGGRGPTLLLLHGTGSSSHSWADLLPVLSREARVVVPDLPGHGFTRGADARALALPALARALDTLLDALDARKVAAVVGHSAGAAVALRWALLAHVPPRAVIGFNPSLVPPPSLYTSLLAPWIVPVATSSPFTGWLASLAQRSRLVDNLLDSTRSAIPPAQRERYATLFRHREHVQGTMRFMAAADLDRLLEDVAALRMPATFVVGEDDPWVPERSLVRVIGRRLPSATVVRWPGGHVLHEAEPERAARFILATMREPAPLT